MPDWYKDYLKTQEEDFQKQEMEAELLSPQLREIMNKTREVPLAMRLFNQNNKDNAGLRDLLKSHKVSQPSDVTSGIGAIMDEL